MNLTQGMVLYDTRNKIHCRITKLHQYNEAVSITYVDNVTIDLSKNELKHYYRTGLFVPAPRVSVLKVRRLTQEELYARKSKD